MAAAAEKGAAVTPSGVFASAYTHAHRACTRTVCSLLQVGPLQADVLFVVHTIGAY
jgi:hypothetical protein